MNPIVILIVVLAAVAAGGIAYGLMFGSIQEQKRADGRVQRVASAETDHAKAKAARDRIQDASRRRKSMQDTIKEMEKRNSQKAKAIGLREKLVQTGRKVSVRQFYIGSVVIGVVACLFALVLSKSLLIAAGVGFAASIGLPRWIVNFLIGRRKKKFLEEFPNALDIMVRSIRSGLPLNDAIRMISSDGQEPVKGEFRRVVEAQQIGFSIPEACARMIQTIPLQEVSFFAIVIAIQSQAGGNLSEALGNLSRVLRERKKMKSKVAALSMEAKASAAIIGALPFIVALLVYLTSPAYIMILFTDPRGHLILGFSAIWMSIGIAVMKNMVSFDI